MRYVITALAAASIAALVGCEQTSPGPTASTTVVKEPVVTKEKETIVQAPAQPQPAAPETTERSKTTTTSRVDTPMGTVSKTETERTKTTQ